MMPIFLRNANVCLVDDEDYEMVTGFGVWNQLNDTQYAVKKINGVLILMHRMIMREPDELEVDHISRDQLDNRKVNLRMATREQNSRNRRLRHDSSTGVKGVCIIKGRYVARIRFNGTLNYLGSFGTADEAGQAYDEAARQHHGEFASTNESQGLLTQPN